MKIKNVPFFYFDTYTKQPINGGRAFTWKTNSELKEFILYNNGICRIDNHASNTTEYFEGQRKVLKWWRRFEKTWLVEYDKANSRKSRQKKKAYEIFYNICDKLGKGTES